MAYEKIKRNRYFNPPYESPHSSRNHYEDMQEFHRPLTRMQNANLHNWGIARGLEVTGTLVSTTLEVQPGVTIDGDGELISLSLSGQGDIGANPDGGQHNPQSVPVDLSSLLGSESAYKNKWVYVTIAFSEILRPLEGSGGREELVPWIRLQPTSGAGAYVHDGKSVILAVAHIDATGNLDQLEAEHASATHNRQVIGQSIETLTIKRSRKAGNSVEDTASGKIEPGNGGGLKVLVSGAADDIVLATDGGGNFDNLDVQANRTRLRGELRVDGGDKWLQMGPGGDGGRLWVEYGSQYAPLLVMSDRDDPPRLQFQQTGSGGTEASPQHKSWIGHARGKSSDIAIMNGKVGIGTTSPNRPLTVQGSGGTYVNVKANNGAREVLLGADGNGGIVSTMTNHDLQLGDFRKRIYQLKLAE